MNLGKRITAVYILLVLLMTVCLFSLYRAATGTKAAEALGGQYSRRLPVIERRGFIFDRHGKLLNADADGYVCLADPSKCSSKKETAEILSEISGRPQSEITELFLKNIPFTLTSDKPFPEAELACGVYCFPVYRSKISAAPHVVGYTNSDGRGVSGAEKGFDAYLRDAFAGTVSYSYDADALGRSLDGSGSILYDNGYSELSGVFLTLDRELQQFCEDNAPRHMTSGAVVVSDIESGEILASVSLPEFDPDRIADYLDSAGGELINRCASGFTPGSIFKTVVAAAALSKDPSLYSYKYECKGHYSLPDNSSFSCHRKSGHGSITMAEAYAQSCNPYFISLALELGAEKVLSTARAMGLGERHELYGICSYGTALPEFSPEAGFAANTAIGQGKLLLTPYEAASLFGCAATGYLAEPLAVREIFRGNHTVKRFSSEKKRVLPENVCEKLREMMGLCIQDGLGKEASPEGGDAGGKTATAQTGQLRDGKEVLNTWFCGIYPLSKPEYSIAVLCDGTGGEGNAKAIFRSICEYLSCESLSA